MPMLLYFVPAWAAGLFLQGWLGLDPLWLIIGASAGGLLAGYAFFYNFKNSPTDAKYKQLPLYPGVILAALCLGGLRMLVAQPDSGPGGVLHYVDKGEIHITGVISGDPAYTAKSGSYRLSVRHINLPYDTKPIEVSGDVFVRTTLTEREAGDLLELVGTLEMPQTVTGEGFPYRDYLARQGMYTTISYPKVKLLATGQDFFLSRWLNWFRHTSLDIVSKSVAQPEAGLLNGILLGDTRNLDLTVKDNFRRTGTSHIIAISGTNITIVIAGLSFLLLRFFKKRTALILALVGVVLYVLLVGASASVVRAAVMGAIATVGILLGREYVALYGLWGAALLMTLFEPRFLFDVGFQLSFMATLGIILIAQPLQQSEKLKNWPPFLQEGLILTLAAELAVWPLLVFYFNQLSVVSLPTNLLALPALIFVMMAGGILLLVGWTIGWLLPFVTMAAGGVAWLFLTYMINVVEMFANLPFASLSVPTIHPVWIVVYYGAGGLLLWYVRVKESWLRRWVNEVASSRIAVGGLALSAVIVGLLAVLL